MKNPISVFENGDVSIFSTVEEAESYMEAIDVENNEYLVKDASGKNLMVQIETISRPILWGLFFSSIKRVRISDPTPES